ncbi:MAG: riboflavin synthase [Tissierellia bacterium]|nr:riboflavin synthase [Tissierellia bacterium]
MFTGIIEEVGSLKRISRKGSALEIEIYARLVLEGTKLGDSIATNGVCLTVVEIGSDFFKADVMPQTVKLTNLHALKPGSPVNLERAMAVGGRLDGHIVQGHVDGLGKLRSVVNMDSAHMLTIETDKELLLQMVDRGSVALDGISLTIVEVGQDYFKVSIIPTTGKDSQILKKKHGDLINIECDIVGKYIKRFMEKLDTNSGITKTFLEDVGFI